MDMVYTPIQDKMPARCNECKDDACAYWSRNNDIETRHPKCPLVEFPNRADADHEIRNALLISPDASVEVDREALLDKLGFLKEKE